MTPLIRQPWMRSGLLLLSAGASSSLAGCLQLTYQSLSRFTPPDAAAKAQLEPGQTLAHCLCYLGAPWRLVTQDHDQGLILVYAWESGSRWGLFLSGGGDASAASLSYSDSGSNLRALTLFFDAEDQLERFEEGYLSPSLASRLLGNPGQDPDSTAQALP